MARSGRRTPPSRWSQRGLDEGAGLELDLSMFAARDPRALAEALMRRAESTPRRGASPYRSAMSMLTLYIHHAGNALSPSRRRLLEHAKHELRALGHADESPPPPSA